MPPPPRPESHATEQSSVIRSHEELKGAPQGHTLKTCEVREASHERIYTVPFHHRKCLEQSSPWRPKIAEWGWACRTGGAGKGMVGERRADCSRVQGLVQGAKMF